MAGWNTTLRGAITNYRQERTGRDHIVNVITKLLADAKEVNAYDLYQEDAVIDAVIEASANAYDKHMRRNFVRVLDGKKEEFHGW